MRDGISVWSFAKPDLPGSRYRRMPRKPDDRWKGKGFEHFSTQELTLDGRPAIRTDYDTTRFDLGPWFVREYFLVAGGVGYASGLGTSRPDVDRATYDEMAARFHLHWRHTLLIGPL
jgi:hypothetical protein